jgi:signal transduction histidine kinase/CheY-like chemotaxis protein
MTETDRLAVLEEENRRLREINRVLIGRVEREMDPAASSAFSLFYNTVTVDSNVTHRTTTLTNLARRLMQEIGERKEAEKALLEAKAVAEQANESKTNFLAAISHDLRQPLHAARLFLAESAETTAPARGLALRSQIEFALDAMDDMLESLLDMSRMDAGSWRIDPETFAIGPLLARLIAEFQPEAVAAGLRLRHVATQAVVHTDRRLLERIVRNLIGNALRYTLTGGILVGARPRAGSLRIDVIDTGIGIPREQWQIIFQEFHQVAVPTRQHGKGLGLGLAIVDRASRLLGARLEIFSEPGRGSRFSVTVPRIEAAARLPTEVAPENTDAAALERRRVLLVEDDFATRAGLSNLLRSWQCDVLEADGTEAALTRIAHLGRGPDVIIADFQLHGTDCGTAAVRAVRMKCGRDVPALIVSGDQSAGLRTAAREAGAMFLVKPVPPSKLRATLNYLLSRSDAT